MLSAEKKARNEKIVFCTCYDYTFAKIVETAGLDAILVGDSSAMVMHGYPDVIPATVPMLAAHTAAVARGAKNTFIVADMPFLSFRQGKYKAAEAAGALMRAGAQAVKIEGVEGHEDVIEFLVQSGIPVMGHIGLTPQSLNQLGGFKVQGKTIEAAARVTLNAQQLESLGCFSVVLECIPQGLGQTISEQLTIPTIGIGAGEHTDGQILVLQDLLGMNTGFKPKFLRTFLDGAALIQNALQEYKVAVQEGTFPNEAERYR